MSSSSFNHKFADEYEKSIIKIVQESTGCFNQDCEKQNSKPTLRCSRCKVAKYCSKECQVIDWKYKSCPHKELCQVYSANVAPDSDGENGPVAIALNSIGLLNNEEMEECMKLRSILFLEEVKRSMECDEPGIFLTACVVYQHNFGMARLSCSASFYVEGIVCVSRVVYKCVDEGTQAQRALYESGKMSDKYRQRVIEALGSFFSLANEHGVCINGVTYGQGLTWMLDEEFLEGDEARKLKEMNNGRQPMYEDDAMESLMSVAFGELGR